jgi:predicted dehydrogenase
VTALRFGILSTADIGVKKVIPGIQKADNCEVVAIASRSLDRARAVATDLGIPEAYGSYEDLLVADTIDAVYIPLPNHLHKEWSVAAARAGKHVLCEKPLALNSEDAQEMVDACEHAGVAFMEAFMYRLHPSWRRTLDLVRSGRIGAVRAVECAFSYYNDDPDNIRNRVETGGGALMDIGCYPINAARMIFDAEPSRIVSAIERHPDFGTDVVTSAILEFDHGHATFTVSTLAESEQYVVILGERGRIRVDIPFNIPPDRPSRVHLFRGGSPPEDPDVETFEFDTEDPYTSEARAFAAAVLVGEPVPTPPSDGVANMRVIERILASAG